MKVNIQKLFENTKLMKCHFHIPICVFKLFIVQYLVLMHHVSVCAGEGNVYTKGKENQNIASLQFVHISMSYKMQLSSHFEKVIKIVIVLMILNMFNDETCRMAGGVIEHIVKTTYPSFDCGRTLRDEQSSLGTMRQVS